ncbi:hypothetical protein BT69DRAFT_1325142 [Atractiella rhizophila]|nr:hypothetical protein BT69DRAFT_1325142 [Atractiella rhizophila]
MGKSKKQKTQAGDFTKSKLKVGKGKQQASNATSTAFRAKAITLPLQSISKPIHSTSTPFGSLPSTSRAQQLPDLLAHLNHPNASTRKDAVHSLTQILKTLPFDSASDAQYGEVLLSVVTPIARLVGASESVVRSKVHSFVEALVENSPAGIPPAILDPIIRHSILTTSHISLQPKLDAVNILRSVLSSTSSATRQHATRGLFSAFADGANTLWGPKVLEGLLGLAGVRTPHTTSTSTSVGSGTTPGFGVELNPQARLTVLSALTLYLQEVLEGERRTDENERRMDFLRPSFNSNRAYDAFNRAMAGVEAEREVEVSLKPSVEVLGRGSGGISHPLLSADAEWNSFSYPSSSSTIQTSTMPSTKLELALLLGPCLHSTLLEHLPLILSSSSSTSASGIHFNIVLEIMRCARLIYRAACCDLSVENGAKEKKKLRDELERFCFRAGAYFPSAEAGVTAAEKEKRRECDLAYAELVSLAFAMRDAGETSREEVGEKVEVGKKRKRVEGGEKVDALLDGVREFVKRILEDQETLLSKEEYTSLLLTLWGLISTSSALRTRDDTLTSVLKNFKLSGKTSGAKVVGFEFIKATWMLQGRWGFKGEFSFRYLAKETKAGLQEWVLSLPRWLWELGASNAPLTKSLLVFIHLLAKSPPSLLPPSTATELAKRLIPFFCAIHPTKGEVWGPYVKIAPRERELALAIGVYLQEQEEGLAQAIRKAEWKMTSDA